MTRADKINAGLIWQVSHDDDPDTVLFEGSKTAANRYAFEKYGRKYHRAGAHIGQLIWENEPAPSPELVTLPEPNRDAEKREQFAQILERRHRRLVGQVLDTTGDLFDQLVTENPLFAVPTPRAAL